MKNLKLQSIGYCDLATVGIVLRPIKNQLIKESMIEKKLQFQCLCYIYILSTVKQITYSFRETFEE